MRSMPLPPGTDALAAARYGERGFDFLDYHLIPAGLTVGRQMIANFFEKASPIHELEGRMGTSTPPLETSVRRCRRWPGATDWSAKTSAGSPGRLQPLVETGLLCDGRRHSGQVTMIHSMEMVSSTGTG